jgi:hypothetical protein
MRPTVASGASSADLAHKFCGVALVSFPFGPALMFVAQGFAAAAAARAFLTFFNVIFLQMLQASYSKMRRRR